MIAMYLVSLLAGIYFKLRRITYTYKEIKEVCFLCKGFESFHVQGAEPTHHSTRLVLEECKVCQK
jgi:hypothetical protein